MSVQKGQGAFFALKAATRRAIRIAGGVDGAETVTRVGRTSLSNYQNAEHAHVIPLDAALDLDTANDKPEILDAYAAQLGYGTYPLSERAREVKDPIHALVKAQSELGDVHRAAEKALEDGRYSLAELNEMEREGHEHMDAMRVFLNSIAAKKASVIRPVEAAE